MKEQQQISITVDVHRAIEQARESFDETSNDILRRLLEIGAQNSRNEPSNGEVEKRSWTGRGVILPHGTKLRMEYRARIHTGIVENGVWKLTHGTAISPSDAASQVARTKDGKRPNLNGWKYWYVKLPEDAEWQPLLKLREGTGK